MQCHFPLGDALAFTRRLTLLLIGKDDFMKALTKTMDHRRLHLVQSDLFTRACQWEAIAQSVVMNASTIFTQSSSNFTMSPANDALMDEMR